MAFEGRFGKQEVNRRPVAQAVSDGTIVSSSSVQEHAFGTYERERESYAEKGGNPFFGIYV